MRRIVAILLCMICIVHIASNAEAWIRRKRAGLPFRFLP